MHNLTKIRLFRWLLRLTWFPSLVFVYPFALFRRRLRLRHVFFFDRYSLGGAQRVHLDILSSIPEAPKLVLFTRRSPNEVMKEAFNTSHNTRCADIHLWCDNLVFRLFAVHYWAFFLNRHRGLKIFSSNSTFFYDLLPWLRRDHERMELLHNFTYGKKGMEFFGLANHEYLNKRITVDAYTAESIRKQYAVEGVPVSYADRILTIEPGVEIPALVPAKPESPLNVLYAGRGGPQKRVWLIDRIATYFYREGLPVAFHFAGDMESDLSEYVKKNSAMYGLVSEPARMRELYEGSHVILLTSAYEGFPMVIKEGMANGCIPVVTALPGNLTHLTDGVNALLIQNFEDEDFTVSAAIEHLSFLSCNVRGRNHLSKNCYAYAHSTFDKSLFIQLYRTLLI